MLRPKPFLRQYAESALPLVKSIRDHHTALHAAREAGDREGELHALGPIGEAFRMLGQLDKALPHLEQALALARELEKPRHVLTNALRLATALQYANRHAEAEPLFQEALALAERERYLEDFVQQHYGKHLAELGRKEEAIARFERALALREAKSDPDLLASTREALEAARALG